MKPFFLIAIFLVAILASCKKDNKAIADDTPPPVDQRDKLVGTWEGRFYLEIPNIPPNSPLENLPDSVPTTLTITKSASSAAEIQIVINNSITGNRTTKAFVNGSRYFYEPFNAKFLNIVDVSFRGDGLLSADGSSITEEGFLKTSAVNIPPLGPFPGINLPALIGVWSSKLKKKL
jgi:hypothetical protein